MPTRRTRSHSYLNPVYKHNFPDPYVLKHCGVYWAYCTGLWRDGRVFGILRSQDLVQWQEVGSGMAPLPGEHPCYWAPEVIYDNGRFFMYYSVGNEEQMHIRVATAKRPQGPFVDSGRRLTPDPFAIDPHVFEDDDGQRYLFYAVDFYDHTHIGTGTVMARLLDPFTLAEAAHPVTRPRFDWQLYDPQRTEKGGVRWHTVEGPFVLKRKGIYYQMFSGGNWRHPGYGVGYAVSDNLQARREWRQICDGERVPPILQTVPDAVVGPGHNSVVRGPDNQELYCVYHRWGEDDGRLMAIDRLSWTGNRLLILGPSHTVQEAPRAPTFADFLGEDERQDLGAAWRTRGKWRVSNGAALADGRRESAEAAYDLAAPTFVLEVSLCFAAVGSGAEAGITLKGDGQEQFQFRLRPGEQRATIRWRETGGRQEDSFPLPHNFDCTAYHLVRLETNGQRLSLHLDNTTVLWHDAARTASQIALYVHQAQAAFAGLALTLGWNDTFIRDGTEIGQDWLVSDDRQESDGTVWRVASGQLWFQNEKGEGRISKGPLLGAYELLVNARLDSNREEACYGFLPALSDDGSGPLLTVKQAAGSWQLCWQQEGSHRTFQLPARFDGTRYQQFRLRKAGGQIDVYWEDQYVGSGQATNAATRVGLYGRQGVAAFDQVRVTAI